MIKKHMDVMIKCTQTFVHLLYVIPHRQVEKNRKKRNQCKHLLYARYCTKLFISKMNSDDVTTYTIHMKYIKSRHPIFNVVIN